MRLPVQSSPHPCIMKLKADMADDHNAVQAPPAPAEPEKELASLLHAAANAPGINDLLALYGSYQRLDMIAGSVRQVMQPRRISSVSDGSYPSLKV
jgi:hypothetical protein